MNQPSKHDWGALFWVGVAMVAILIMTMWMVLASKAKAQEGGDRRDARWHTQRFCANYDWTGHCTRYRYERRRLSTHYGNGRYHEPERVYSYQRRYDDERDDQRRCKPEKSTVGDQHLTVEGAKKNANDAWSAAVRFYHGERFLDLSNAREISYVCSRSSIKQEGSVTTLGQTFSRCEISAVPCAPQRQGIEGER